MDERCVRVFEHRERDGVLVRLDESSGLDLVVGPFVALLAFRYSPNHHQMQRIGSVSVLEEGKIRAVG